MRQIRRDRFADLDKIGFDELVDLYIEEASGVRELMQIVFEPSRPGQKPGASDFYAWLDARGLRDEWTKWVEIKVCIKEDEALEYGMLAMDNPRLMPGAKSEVSRRLWAARRGRTSKA